MQNITLTVSLEEANLILEALGNLPFARVYGLINKMQAQAQAQIEPPVIVEKKEGAA